MIRAIAQYSTWIRSPASDTFSRLVNYLYNEAIDRDERTDPAEELAPALDRMNRVLRAAGIEAEHPIVRIATVALPVIPSIKLTDRGLVDTVRQELVRVFA